MTSSFLPQRCFSSLPYFPSLCYLTSNSAAELTPHLLVTSSYLIPPPFLSFCPNSNSAYHLTFAYAYLHPLLPVTLTCSHLLLYLSPSFLISFPDGVVLVIISTSSSTIPWQCVCRPSLLIYTLSSPSYVYAEVIAFHELYRFVILLTETSLHLHLQYLLGRFL